MPHALLETEEYVEQAYFFRVFRQRLEDSVPSQVILADLKEEILATTKLPMALDFLVGEMVLNGRMAAGMARLDHYFTEFQTYIISAAEDDYSRFDQRTALEILQYEAEYRIKDPTPAGMFVYHFECLSRNKLGYDAGMKAMAGDPIYDKDWSEWILRTRLQLGATDFADLICMRSQYSVDEYRRKNRNPDYEPAEPVLFGHKAGRIAYANRGRDPLYMFAALQRHLGYPAVPRPQPKTSQESLVGELKAKLLNMEKRLTLLERESKNQLDISEFYVKPDTPAESPWKEAAEKEHRDQES
ncbi:hypothetical protein CA54_04460 [Symmachiella macrocystis]|uniref:Uncharacterized protein n=1 Tax=Symmachiella macrocystis TaxID=2527985 RepID=A0A5C6BHV8_9PLAN|nr:hypothetical protein [Symmachiella macrocystis]TWU11638.1 hypothetical protein CA54_04460 [Symmachiella macrocystis]